MVSNLFPHLLPLSLLLSVYRGGDDESVYIIIVQESFKLYFLYIFLSSFREHRGTGLPRWNELNGHLSVILLINSVSGFVHY